MSSYTWIDTTYYAELGAYRSPGQTTLTRHGADPFSPGDIDSLAPYGGFAYQNKVAGGTLEVGAFGIRTDINPGRDRTTGFKDRYSDLGVDASYQNALGSGDVGMHPRWVQIPMTISHSAILGL